jgi:ABC-type glycerol-3-phosphate transport system permease component
MSSAASTPSQLAPRAAYLMVALGAVVMLLPFYFMFVFASHSRTEMGGGADGGALPDDVLAWRAQSCEL